MGVALAIARTESKNGVPDGSNDTRRRSRCLKIGTGDAAMTSRIMGITLDVAVGRVIL
jgi:hypothetical protein